MFRIGMGFDAHRFEAGRKLVLGGVEIPFDRGLAGHSDADVVLHALMDALLGACGRGDIGQLFPETDRAYLGVSSLDLLDRVMRIVRGEGYAVVNVDLVVICGAPKISPYRDRMRESVAHGCGIDPGAVSVKGTTTEGMGFAGRGEGVAGMAAVLLEMDSPTEEG